MKINLGCGDEKLLGYTNLDSVEELKPDILHDLDDMPWPFEDESAEEINAADVYEHVADPLAFMNECWRILEKEGILKIRSTCWETEQSYTDPTHRRFLTLNSFDYWDKKTPFGKKYWWYSKNKYDILSKNRDGQELVFVLRKRTGR